MMGATNPRPRRATDVFPPPAARARTRILYGNFLAEHLHPPPSSLSLLPHDPVTPSTMSADADMMDVDGATANGAQKRPYVDCALVSALSPPMLIYSL